jgi:spore coat protein U-like protein
MKKGKILAVLSLLAASLLMTGAAYGGQVTGSFQVTANVIGACTVSTSNINFGDVTGVSEVKATGDVTVNCSSGLSYGITLGGGEHFASWRHILDVTNLYGAQYELYQPDGTTSWGDGTLIVGGSVLFDTGNGTDQTHTVNATLLTFSGIPAGTALSDTVGVYVQY